MEKRFSREFFIKVLLAGLFVFAISSNIQLIGRNYQLNKILSEKREVTAKQALNNQKLKSLIAYYQTPSYQEVEARRRLGLKKPDETVYIIKGLVTSNNQSSLLSDSLYADVQPAPPIPRTNIQQWWEYFFGK